MNNIVPVSAESAVYVAGSSVKLEIIDGKNLFIDAANMETCEVILNVTSCR